MTDEEILLRIQEISTLILRLANDLDGPYIKMMADIMSEYRVLLLSILGQHHNFDINILLSPAMNPMRLNTMRLQAMEDVIDEMKKLDMYDSINKAVNETTAKIKDTMQERIVENLATIGASQQVKN